jgi:hypothetical protein
LFCSLALIVPEKVTDFIGVTVLILTVWFHLSRARKSVPMTAPVG